MAAAETLVRELFGHAGIQIGGAGPGDIQVHDSRFYGRVVREASIGFGESYMDGWWDTDALDVLLEKIMRGGLRQKMTGSARMRLLTAKAIVLNLQSKARSGKSVEAHYDIGNDLYTKMLDPRMVYTCGYWKNATTLAEAQEAKLDLVCRKLGLKAGMRVLDLGCGWGGFAAFAAERYGCSVVGVTLIEGPARAGARDVEAPGRRSAPLRLPRRHRHVRSRLVHRHDGARRPQESPPRDGGGPPQPGRRRRSPSSTPSPTTRAAATGRPFVEKYIFPNAVAPSLAQLGRAIEGLFVLEDLQNIGPDYERTLLAWWENFDRAYPELKAKYDLRFYRMWKFYLLAAAAASRARDGQLYHLVLTKVGRRQPDCRAS